MKNKTHIRLIIILSAFCFLYILFAIRPLGDELHMTPDWTSSIARPETVEDTEGLIPFKLGQSIGYFTADGKIAMTLPCPFNATVSSSYYATYGADNKTTVVKNKDGTTALTLTTPGFPFFDEDRLYMFMPGGNAVAQFGPDASMLWQYESYAPITAFDTSAGATAIGFADGQVVTIRKDGVIDQQFYPGGSEIPVTLGVGISEDGSLVGCVTGQRQQRFSVSKKNEGNSIIIFHEYLPSDLIRQTVIKFNKQANTVYYGYDGGLGIVDINISAIHHAKSYHIPLKGSVSQIEEAEAPNLVFVLSHEGNLYTLTVLEPFDHVLSQASFEAQAAFLQIRGDAIFIGRDDKISRLTVSEK